MGWAAATRISVWATVAAGAAGGALASCAPTGDAAADHLLTAALAGGTTLAAATASPAALAVGAIVLVVGGGSAWVLHAIGLAALIALFFVERRDEPVPIANALIGGVVVQALLRLPWTAPTRGSAVIAAVAIGPILVSGIRRASPGARSALRRVRPYAIGLVAVLAMLFGFVVVRSHALLDAAETHARHGVDAARAGDRDKAAGYFAQAARDFHDARGVTNGFWSWPLDRTPLVAQQIRTVDRIAGIGASTMPIVQASVTRVDPDRLRMRNGRLDLATVTSYQPIFTDLAGRTEKVRAQLKSIGRTWLLPPLENGLARFEHTVDKADDSAHTAEDAITLAPALFGAQRDAVYFVAFVTPAEARASGGFMANYGVLVAHDGKLKLDIVGRGPDLDHMGSDNKQITGPADYVSRYTKFDVANTWENITMSPDFPSVARAMAELYPQSGGRPVDGVMRIGPDALAGLLEITGPISTPGLPYELNSNNVADFLLRKQYTDISDNSARLDELGVVARATFDKLTSGVSAKPSRIADAMAPALREGDMAFWFRDAAQERFAKRVNVDGAVAPVHGDSFGVTVQNGGGSKIDVFLHRTIKYSATVDGATGAVNAHADVTLRNDSPSAGVPDYVIGNEVGVPSGTSRLYVSIYSPFGLRRATLDKQPLALTNEFELGRFVYANFVDIPPGASRTIRVDLRGQINLVSGTYHFDEIRQQLPNADSVTWQLTVDRAHVHGNTPDPDSHVIVTHSGHVASVLDRRARTPFHVDIQLRR